MKVSIGRYPKHHKTKRRVNIQIDDYDVWNMDGTLTMIILPMLKKIAKEKNGGPFVDDVDVPKKLHATKLTKKEKDQGGVDKNWFKRWHWVMQEMIWTFEQIHPDYDWEMQYHSGKIKFLETKNEDGSVTWSKHPKDTHKFDKKGYEKHQARISNGLRLFGKYYQALWT